MLNSSRRADRKQSRCVGKRSASDDDRTMSLRHRFLCTTADRDRIPRRRHLWACIDRLLPSVRLHINEFLLAYQYFLSLAYYSPNSTRPSRLDTFDVSSASRRACRAVLFDKLDTAKMHGFDTSNVSSRVKTWRDEPSGIWAIDLYSTQTP